MFELSLHILDLVQNSIAAGARIVRIGIEIDELEGILTLRILDDGCGMDEATVKRMLSPFATSRTSRRVGLGIPMMAECAQRTGGELTIDSQPGVGTTVTARFGLRHIDRPPVGDLADTYASLVLCNPALDFAFALTKAGTDETAEMDTRELREVLGDVPLDTPDVVSWIRESLREMSVPWSV